ncbi:MAG: hypothetical protein A2Z34_12120 [Planctomycetes bacterium RBG_16_59_8]|nr:MAG: hypothetical protein A2Z34_12120 [Planctomycetes bacterium RBG_16_59_8]
MFERLAAIADVPKDADRARFDADPRPRKIFLAGGSFKNERGKSPILSSVRRAQERLLRRESTKEYLHIDGDPSFLAAAEELILGKCGKAAVIQTPGGTAALRLAGEVLRGLSPAATLWVSDPTWGNHRHIFRAAGLATRTYPYPVIRNRLLDFRQLSAGIRSIPKGGYLLLQGSPHNPTGIDPSPDQWSEIASLVRKRGIFPIVDIAFLGFAEGIDEDLAGVRILAAEVPELLVAVSFSKAFSLYRERVGALIVVGKHAERFRLHAKHAVRAAYSAPPSHGAALVALILRDARLRALWEKELRAMRDRIRRTRRRFADLMAAHGVARDYSFALSQRGLFLPTGCSAAEVGILRERHAIYLGPGGGVNVTACTTEAVVSLARFIRPRKSGGGKAGCRRCLSGEVCPPSAPLRPRRAH